MKLRLFAALFVLLAAASPSLAKDRALPSPALWRVADADSEIYIFAAAPFLPAGEAWRSRAVAAAIDRAETIWFEAPSADPAAQAAAAKIFQNAGRYPEGRSLSEALGDNSASSLASATQAVGADPAAIDALKPWAAFVVLSAELDRKRGADPAAGVEAGVLLEAIGRQRPVKFLDTVEGALSVLTEMPESDQRALLGHLLADWPRQDERAPGVYESWRAGDTEALVAEAQAPLRDAAPAAYDRLVAARAVALADKVAALLDLSDEAFVCLGVALIVGEDGIVANLAARGLTVERMDGAP
ncbi:MAG: TraB/GumN family protein [Parvularculaceae bacterium]|nr:TraB/GumN family protein [Parvularculaceae bacterium]